MHQWSNPKVNTDAKKGHYYIWGTIIYGALSGGSMLPKKILKIRCPRLAKSSFAIQLCYLLLQSNTFTHYRTIEMVALIIAFLRLWREFFSEFLLFSKLLHLSFFFLSWGNMFWELKKFSRANGPAVRHFFHPWIPPAPSFPTLIVSLRFQVRG